MAKLDDIVSCDISLEQPVSDSASYSNLLLITPKPTTATQDTTNCFSITDEADLLEYGYTNSDAIYNAAALAFAQENRPACIYIAARQIGSDGETEEELSDTLARAAQVSGWYGIGIVVYDTAADLKAVATFAEQNEKLFVFTYTSGDCPIDVSTYNRTFAMYAGDVDADTVPENNSYQGIGWAAECFGYEPGSETWALKTITGATPSVLSSSKAATLKEGNINTYQTYANRDVTNDGVVGSGEWIDNIRFRDWIKNEIQVRVFEYLAANSKVMYSNAGITGVYNAISAVLKLGQTIGGIDEDYVDENDALKPAFTVTVPKASEITKAQRRSRKLVNVYWTARLASAIHMVTIHGKLTY